MSLAPMILTLILDRQSQDFFNKLRKAYFPAERNYLDAHLTLFHNLPQDNTGIATTLNQLCARTPPFILKVHDIVSIGNGVAYKLESAILQDLHKHLQQEWQQWLIPQDKQKLWPHITVQNKTDPGSASQLREMLQHEFEPFTVDALGFYLWEYKGGPWEFMREFRFNS